MPWGVGAHLHTYCEVVLLWLSKTLASLPTSPRRSAPSPVPLPPSRPRALAELVTRRQQVIEMIDRESNRRRTARSPKLLRGIECSLAALQAALTELDREIDDQIRAPPAWFEMAGRLARTTVTQAFRGYSTAGSATV